jgi:phosphoribosyl 1,2-cyclic phosphate phosphodiesterase
MNNHLLFLGTGASMGVPVIGCNCAVCHSTLKFNHRLRPSALLVVNQKKLLIDTGPDFRQQALHHKIDALDGLIFTHAHHDHTAGLDDLRAIFYKKEDPLPILLSPETAHDIIKRFDYLFLPNPYLPEKGSRFALYELPNKQGEIIFEGIKIRYLTYEQGGMQVNGYRFGDLAYLTDIKIFNESIFDSLYGVKKLVISALRFTSSPLHFTVDEAVDFATKVGAEEVWLTHISHDLDHEKVNAYLPDHINLAYDGLTIYFG